MDDGDTIECLPNFGCQQKKMPNAAATLTVATEVEFVDEEEENKVSVVTVSASNKTGNTKSSLSTLTSKFSSSSGNNQTVGWPPSIVSAYILCPNNFSKTLIL